MTETTEAPRAFEDWYTQLPIHKASGGPAKGTIAAALVVLERLKADFNLDLSSPELREDRRLEESLALLSSAYWPSMVKLDPL